MPDNSPKLVPALVRGVQVLDTVAKSKKSLKVTEIADLIGVAKSSVHGICMTLTELNLLVKKSDHTYQLGPHIMRWSNRFTHESDVATEFASIWDESSSLPGATITLSVLEGAEVVYLAARNAELSVGYSFRIGMRLPAAFTATGKAFLSFMSNGEVRRLLNDQIPDPLTENSVQDIETLLDELEVVRQQGYSIDNQQVKMGMVCYGASVLDSLNRPIAGVAVSLSADAISEIGEKVIVDNIKEISKKISFRLGAEL
ncbi:MAG: IclR family transcriptional regulator [Roseovarius sp.]|nr:IclR family transcriptional regulator [Roseovarius sp.]